MVDETLMLTSFCKQFELSIPLVQAPMAGGATTPALVAGVCNAGGLGSLAGALLTPQQMSDAVAAIRELTGKPFAINLFVQDEPALPADALSKILKLLAPLHELLGIEQPRLPDSYCQPFTEQFEMLLHLRPAAASFTFGLLSVEQVARLKQHDVYVIGTGTNVAEARAWRDAGADAICAQGVEAGGHRGTFIGHPAESMLPMVQLVHAITQEVDIPVLAAGGMMTGRDMVVGLHAGAQACQLGTAFLRCPESGISYVWKQALSEAREGDTALTRAFSGRHARGLMNRYMQEMKAYEEMVPDYPVMNALTTPLRQAAAQQGKTDWMSLWAGVGVANSRELPVADLVVLLEAECQQAWLESRD